MSQADLAALIALYAAPASAIGDAIRQRSAQEITDKESALGRTSRSTAEGCRIVSRDLRREAQDPGTAYRGMEELVLDPNRGAVRG